MFFRKANPFNGVPALSDDLRGDVETACEGKAAPVGSVDFAGDGVKGVENGWAADVDVAAGGDCGWKDGLDVEMSRMDVVMEDGRRS